MPKFLPCLTLAALVTLAATPTVAQAPPAPGEPQVREQTRQVFTDIGRIVSPRGIDEQRMVALGGVKQWILLRGQDRTAPILLFLHGGPGSPISPVVYSYQRPWEDYFLVVNWDQRGFGRSRGTAAEAAAIKGTLNRAQYIADTVELIEKLRTEFGQRKIVLVGQSWGTVLGLEVAHRRPDLLHALVTQGLAANWLDSPRMLYRHFLEEAERKGDTAELERLKALGPLPPVDKPADLFVWARKLGRGFPDANTWHNIMGPGDGWSRRLDSLAYVSPDVPAAEYEAQKRFEAENPALVAERYQEAMSSVLPWDAERDVGTRLKVPFIVMQGTHDWQTSRDLARAYFNKVCAPWKKWVEFPHAAHALNVEQPGLSVVSLVNDVLPATRDERPEGAAGCRR